MASTSGASKDKVFIVTQCFLDVHSPATGDLNPIFKAKLSGFLKEQTLSDIFNTRLNQAIPPLDVQRNKVLIEAFVDKLRSDRYPFGLECELDVPVSEIFGEENMRVVTFLIKRLPGALAVNSTAAVAQASSSTASAVAAPASPTKERRPHIGLTSDLAASAAAADMVRAKKPRKRRSDANRKREMKTDNEKVEKDNKMEVTDMHGHGKSDVKDELNGQEPIEKPIIRRRRGGTWSRVKGARSRPAASATRRRRPRSAAPQTLVEPSTEFGESNDDQVKRRRGRPAGSRNRTTLASECGMILTRNKPGRKSMPKMMADYVMEDQELPDDVTGRRNGHAAAEREKDTSPEPFPPHDAASARLISASGLAPRGHSINWGKDPLTTNPHGLRENMSGTSGSPTKTDHSMDYANSV